MIGFEPTTLCSQSRCATPALHPDFTGTVHPGDGGPCVHQKMYSQSGSVDIWYMKWPLWALPADRRKAQRDAALEFLQNTPVFGDIPERGLRTIRALCHVRTYKQDEHVFRTGEPGVGMYVIMEGSIEIYQDREDYRHEYALLYPGEFFGEIALLDDLPRTASARARSYTQLLGFYRPDLLNLLARTPAVAGNILLNIARLIGQRLLATNQELERLHLQLMQKGRTRSILERAGTRQS